VNIGISMGSPSVLDARRMPEAEPWLSNPFITAEVSKTMTKRRSRRCYRPEPINGKEEKK